MSTMRGCGVAIVLVLSLAATPVSAQQQQRQRGGKVGVTAARPHYQTSSTDPGFGNRLFVSGGAFLVQPMTRVLALQLEGLYVSKGGEVAEKDASDTTLTVMLDYVEVPALARVTFVRSPSHSIYLFGGAAPGMRVNAKQRSAAGRPIRSGTTEDIHSDIKFFEMSVIAGGGVDIGSHGLVDARYEWGLTNVVKDVADEDAIRNRSFTVMVGLRF